MTDGNQNVVASYKYDAWGNDLTDPQSQVTNPFKYVGGLGYYADRDSTIMLLGVRYYSSDVGRFLSFDPIKEEINWYKYAQNNPNIKVDPTGKASIVIFVIAVIIIMVAYPEPIDEWPPGSGGVEECEYYDDLCNKGDDYACFAAKACRGEILWLPWINQDGGGLWERCVRRCLIGCDIANDCADPDGIKDDDAWWGNWCRWKCHWWCYIEGCL